MWCNGNPKIKNKSTRNALFTGKVPADLHQIDNISVNALIREHSRKPDDMYGLLEDLFHGPYLELFARNRRKGWDCWGNQTDKFEEAV